MKAWQNKLALTVSAILISPMAQAHDSRHSLGMFDHIWAHVAEITGMNTGVLLAAVILAGLFASIFFTRMRTKTATHA